MSIVTAALRKERTENKKKKRRREAKEIGCKFFSFFVGLSEEDERKRGEAQGDVNQLIEWLRE